MLEQKITQVVSSLSEKGSHDFFKNILHGMATALDADFVFIAKIDEVACTATTHTCVSHGEVLENFSYDLVGTPCEVTQNGAVCVHSKGIQPLYPDDQLLIDMAIEGYVGVPIKNEKGRVNHILVALYKGEVKNSQEAESLFLLFSGLIQKELEKQAVVKRLKITDYVIRESHEGVMVVNHKLDVAYVNKAFCQMTGFDVIDVLGKRPKDLLLDETNDAFTQQFWHELSHYGRWSGEFQSKRKCGDPFTAHLSVDEIRDENKRLTHYVGYFSDITESKEQERELFNRTHFDTLTGLANRFYLRERLSQVLSRAYASETPFYLMSFGLDRFKEVNDYFGFGVGDRVLIEAGTRIKEVAGTGPMLARISGDHFALLVEDVHNQAEIQLLAESICQAFKAPINIEGEQINMTLSIGISAFPNDADEADALLEKSEHALYNSKTQGRNTFSFFTEKMQEEAVKRIILRNQLKEAIANQVLDVVYQPIINLGTGRVEKMEALVRWQNGSQWVSPMEFIPIAEEFGLIYELGQLVLHKACLCLVELKRTGWTSISININRSVKEFAEKANCAEEWLAVIHQHGLQSHDINFELTESVLADDHSDYLKSLQCLQDEGCKISLDDFGTGYSSLSYLRRFPVDEMKIDRSFISEMTENREDHTLVVTMLAMANSLGMKTVAEGIETQDQLDELKSLGCDYGQGYFLSRPLPKKDLEDFFARYYEKNKVAANS